MREPKYRIDITRYGFPQRMQAELVALFNANGRRPAKKRFTRSDLSEETAYRRFVNLCASLAELHELGFKIQSVGNLGERHVRALVQHWEAKGHDFGTIDNKVSYLRTLATWINKPDMIHHAREYMADPVKAKRKRIAEVDKSWDAAGIDVLDLIDRVREKDRYVAALMELVLSSGERVQEASKMRIRRAFEQAVKSGQITIDEGTKGGRPRTIDVIDVSQIYALSRALPLVNGRTGTIIPLKYTWDQWRNRVYYIMGLFGIVKATEDGGLGVTLHGLRHQFLQKVFTLVTGLPAPIKGGDGYAPDAFLEAMRRVVEFAGHSDIYKAGAYLGPLPCIVELRRTYEESARLLEGAHRVPPTAPAGQLNPL